MCTKGPPTIIQKKPNIMNTKTAAKKYGPSPVKSVFVYIAYNVKPSTKTPVAMTAKTREPKV